MVYFKNCLFLCNAGRDVANYRNCAFAAMSGQVSDGNVGTGSFKRSQSELKVRSNGMPAESSPLVDAGDDELYSFSAGGDFDLGFKARINGIGIDIGAYEWYATNSGLILTFK